MSVATIPPITSLSDLRREVIQHNPTRMPKWGFRLSSGCALQLQPKPCILRTPYTDEQIARIRARIPEWRDRQDVERFEGRVWCALDAAVPPSVFRGWTPPHGSRWIEVKVIIVGYADAPSVWEVTYRGARWARVLGRHNWSDERDRLMQMLGDALTDGRFDQLGPDLMLRHACLICGKALTDPASMARWIGPECAHSSAITVPGLFRPEARR